jgi:hypothetical protein
LEACVRGAALGTSLRRRTRPPASPRKEATFLCSYPKSGRTWLRFLLANYLDVVFDLRVAVDFHSLFTLVPNEGDRPKRGLPAYRYWDDARVPLVVASHKPYDERFDDSDIVFVVRSPLDTLVSQYFHRSRQLQAFKGDLESYLRDPKFGVSRFIDYVNSWAEPIARHRSLVVSYEDMQADAVEVLARLAEFVGLPTEAEAVQKAVSLSSFERMQELEVRRGIPGHRYDRRDPNARRLRAGRVGGYEDHLAAEDEAYVRSQLRARLTPAAADLLGRYGVAA